MHAYIYLVFDHTIITTYRIVGIITELNFHGCCYSCTTVIIRGFNFRALDYW